MLRRAFGSSLYLARYSRPFSSSVYVRARGSNESFDASTTDRERSAEERDVIKHDKELLEKLKEQVLAAQKKLTEIEGTKPSHTFSAPQDHKAGDFITFSEFMAFRKEIVDQIRDLEDELHELKLKLSRK